MHRRSDEELFLAFRRQRDCDALAVLFRRRVEELLRLAVFLAERPGDAEDLVQATFLSAISRAETFRPDGRVMSWLCGILTNHARMLRRAERRRLAGMPAAPLEEPKEPMHAALRAEVRQALDQGIANLPEPYRSVLTLYLREGLDSREISRRLARPRATVRKQMERAIDRLRVALPLGLATALAAKVSPAQIAAHAAEAARFVEPIGPLEPLGDRSDEAARSPWSPSLAIAALAVAAVVLALPFSLAGPELPVNRIEPPRVVRTSAASPLDRPAPPRVVLAGERTDAALASGLDVEVVDFAGMPRAGVELLLARVDGRALPERLTDGRVPSARTGPDGRAAFANLPRGPYELALPGTLPRLRVALQPGSNTVRLELPDAVSFRGAVVDADGRAVAGAEIVVSETSGRGDLGAVVARTGADGRFTAVSQLERARVFARHPDHGRSTSMRLQPDCSVRLALERARRRVTVLVVDGDDRPLADAYVAIAPRSRSTDMVLPQHGRTDASGRRVFGDPGAREASVVASHRGFAAATVELPPRTTELTVRLTAGGTVRGTAVDERGDPIAGRPVRATLTHSRSNEPAGPLLGREVRTGDDGSFVFPRLPAGPMKIWIGGHDAAESLHRFLNRYVIAGADVEVREGGTHDVRLVGRRPHEIRGRLRNGAGAALSGWHVVALPDHGVAFHRLARGRSARTRADGSFAVHGVAEDATYCLGAFPPGARLTKFDQWPTAICFASAARGQHEFVVASDPRPRSRLRCRVLTPSGAAAVGTAIELRHREFCYPTTRFTAPDGSCEFGPLPAGDYFLSVAAGATGTLTLPVSIRPDGSDEDLGTIQLALPAQLTVNLWRSDGGAVAGARVVGRLTAGDKYVSATVDATGRATLPALPPGDARLLIHGPGIEPVERTLTLTGGPQWLEVDVEPAATVPMRFDFAPVDNPFVIDGPLLVEVRTRSGEVVFTDNVGATTKPGRFELTTGLPTGTYEVRATSMWNASATVEFDVTGDGRAHVAATLRL